MLNKGFTLIEVIVAIFLLTVGSVGAFSLVQSIISFSSLAVSRLEAVYLAQEQLEVVRNTRDTNYLEGSSWLDGVTNDCFVPSLPPCDSYGDVNMDGVVTLEDADMISEFLSYIISLDEIQQNRAKVIDGENITITDALYIAQYVGCSPERTTLPVCSTGFSKFQRTTSINLAQDNIVEVTANVSWNERGRSHEATAQTNLYNWR
ncbi:MAG: prepilin-type N-terminal cleavage/methylation domain-containing protein [Candidatus Nealsonbacteria bacterium]|nr:prepilin-type N-terminal cleavage/methylation domain-containing protein [Candidatus Nealsonbacteria bacterium]